MAWTFCSKADVVAITHAPESALEDFWSDTAEALIRQYMGMPYLGEEQIITGELRDGDGTNIILVRKPPIVSVQALSVDSVALTASEYVVGTYGIELKYASFTKGTLNVSIDYTSGALLIDPILSFTAAAMVAAIWQYRNRGGADSSIKWGSLSSTEGEKSANVNIGLTSHLVAIMKRMLRRERIRVR